MGHIPTLLEDIQLDTYNNFFDCVFVTSAYNDMFNNKNIDILLKILKKKSFLITTYPSGRSELTSKFISYKTDNYSSSYNIFVPTL
jgi:hypothetical protein